MLTIKQQTAASAFLGWLRSESGNGFWLAWELVDEPQAADGATPGDGRRDPLTAREIALALMDHKGLDTSDERNERLLEKRVGCSLRGQREIGHLTSEEGAPV